MQDQGGVALVSMFRGESGSEMWSCSRLPHSQIALAQSFLHHQYHPRRVSQAALTNLRSRVD